MLLSKSCGVMAFIFFFSSEAAGNCLYSSVSILLYGNNSLCSHLRYLTCAELFLNPEFYYKHPLLSQVYDKNKDQFASYDNMFNICVSTISFETDARGPLLVKEESKTKCKGQYLVPFFVYSCVIKCHSTFNSYSLSGLWWPKI